MAQHWFISAPDSYMLASHPLEVSYPPTALNAGLSAVTSWWCSSDGSWAYSANSLCPQHHDCCLTIALLETTVGIPAYLLVYQNTDALTCLVAPAMIPTGKPNVCNAHRHYTTYHIIQIHTSSAATVSQQQLQRYRACCQVSSHMPTVRRVMPSCIIPMYPDLALTITDAATPPPTLVASSHISMKRRLSITFTSIQNY